MLSFIKKTPTNHHHKNNPENPKLQKTHIKTNQNPL